MTKNNEQLKKENDTLKTENHMMKEENHMMKEENVQLKTNGNKQQEENEQLATLLDQLAVNNESQIQLINSQSNTIAKLNIEVHQLKVSQWSSSCCHNYPHINYLWDWLKGALHGLTTFLVTNKGDQIEVSADN